MTPEQELSYIAAFFDGEGTIMAARTKDGKKIMRSISFVNTNKELAETVCDMLRRAGFVVAVARREPKSIKHAARYDCVIRGGKPAFNLFAKLIPLQHPEKRQRMLDIVGHYLSLEDAGRKRGKARAAALTEEQRREISRKALAARWGKSYDGPYGHLSHTQKPAS